MLSGCRRTVPEHFSQYDSERFSGVANGASDKDNKKIVRDVKMPKSVLVTQRYGDRLRASAATQQEGDPQSATN